MSESYSIGVTRTMCATWNRQRERAHLGDKLLGRSERVRPTTYDLANDGIDRRVQLSRWHRVVDQTNLRSVAGEATVACAGGESLQRKVARRRRGAVRGGEG